MNEQTGDLPASSRMLCLGPFHYISIVWGVFFKGGEPSRGFHSKCLAPSLGVGDMKKYLVVFIICCFSSSAFSGKNPDIQIYLRFADGTNMANPTPGTLFTVYLCFENLDATGGITGATFKLNTTTT